jgi:transcriptional regulator with XRE-family HTH domain
VRVNPLEAFRIALPGEPSIRDLAKRIGISHEKLRQFELGETPLSETELAAWAKLVHQPVDEVLRRFYAVRLNFGDGIVRDARDRLREMGHRARSATRSKRTA